MMAPMQPATNYNTYAAISTDWGARPIESREHLIRQGPLVREGLVVWGALLEGF